MLKFTARKPLVIIHLGRDLQATFNLCPFRSECSFESAHDEFCTFKSVVAAPPDEEDVLANKVNIFYAFRHLVCTSSIPTRVMLGFRSVTNYRKKSES